MTDKIGFQCYEDVAVVAANPKAVSKMSVQLKTCPVCGDTTPDLLKHYESVGDELHDVASVLET